MTNLKIRIYKIDETEPKTTVTVPVAVLKFASKLIPRQAAETLQAKGIDIHDIIRLSNNPDAHGTLVAVEEHDKNEKIVIALE